VESAPVRVKKVRPEVRFSGLTTDRLSEAATQLHNDATLRHLAAQKHGRPQEQSAHER
jgi:hypothetical protein